MAGSPKNVIWGFLNPLNFAGFFYFFLMVVKFTTMLSIYFVLVAIVSLSAGVFVTTNVLRKTILRKSDSLLREAEEKSEPQ